MGGGGIWHYIDNVDDVAGETEQQQQQQQQQTLRCQYRLPK